jgi:mannan endo-1,6-alpha-mannosidase
MCTELTSLQTQEQSWTTFAANLLTTVPATFATSSNASTEGADKGNTILYEVACQPQQNCNTDQKSFLGVLARALAQTRDLTRPAEQSQYPGNSRDQLIRSILQDSAKGAAASCSGGASKTLCGQDWALGQFDGDWGMGQELNALEVFLANLPGKTILTANTTTQPSTSVDGTKVGSNTTSASPASATGGASGLSVGTSLPLIALGLVSACMMTL